ncbi:ribbon-helix-helix protein, CopG family [Paenibacillus radicis (ex Gao et al. 2016)]|uniref:Transcriptional regulator n=1 Tax=Paenibacillus radicis (ex Gao et al. 2016) TaxID=1737354 RepID=A0A917HQF8_9BACL|nr:ribbon-helix-helix protein, CopG family [Paenibacillus radicis (ex Gao et al. 2016)]GGG85711.1 transcriptional regulator [Paenibacillus radicis (ex Gao et al. 2016)]
MLDIPELEKITINLGPMDLGQIDLLVDQGYYTNRSDFIRIAIRRQLDSHAAEVKEFKHTQFFAFGALEFDRNRLLQAIEENVKIDIKLVGALFIAKDVTRELAEEALGKIRVFGIIRAPESVKKWLILMNDKK